MFRKSLAKVGTMGSLDASRVAVLHVRAMLLCPEAVSICYVDEKVEIAGEEARFELSEGMEHAVIVEKVLSGELRCLALVVHSASWAPTRLRVFFMVIKKTDESYCRVGTMKLRLRRVSSMKEACDWVANRAESCSTLKVE